jgi:hypothetical protein
MRPQGLPEIPDLTAAVAAAAFPDGALAMRMDDGSTRGPRPHRVTRRVPPEELHPNQFTVGAGDAVEIHHTDGLLCHPGARVGSGGLRDR